MEATSKRIILTGASAGIGKALAYEYAKKGAQLVLVARRAELLEDVAKNVRGLGGKAIPLVADAADSATPSLAIALATQHFGGFDTVVMNAGIGGAMFVDDYDSDWVEEIFRVNVISVSRMVGAVLPILQEQGYGRLVAVSSLAGYRGMSGSAAYNASKSALRIFMEGLRTELRGTGITLTTIAPGFVRTDMTAKNEFQMPFLMEPDKAAKKIIRAIDAGRSEYRFPFSISFAIRILCLLPNSVFDRLVRWGRAKGLRRK